MRLRLHPQAEIELQAAANWYEGRVGGLGIQFLHEATDAFNEIESYPTRFALAYPESLREIRRQTLEHFPYSVIYEVRKEECFAVAIAHAARRPGYWMDRFE